MQYLSYDLEERKSQAKLRWLTLWLDSEEGLTGLNFAYFTMKPSHLPHWTKLDLNCFLWFPGEPGVVENAQLSLQPQLDHTKLQGMGTATVPFRQAYFPETLPLLTRKLQKMKYNGIFNPLNKEEL